jgi:hypothetical protein
LPSAPDNAVQRDGGDALEQHGGHTARAAASHHRSCQSFRRHYATLPELPLTILTLPELPHLKKKKINNEQST